ncbi:hypothetical protein GCM10028864_27550 [Microlunatus parietis]
MVENGAVSTTHARGLVPSRMRSAILLPVGDEGRVEQVEQRLIQAVTGGVLRTGERLPSESELARVLRVSPVTVREALGLLRDRGLITTKRGRSGGSFLTEAADPVVFARDRLRGLTRLALRDLGQHYAAIGSACVALAARRARAEEVDAIRRRLAAATAHDDHEWSRHLDEAVLELTALGQSARLTREQMRLQAEFSPLLALIDGDRRKARETAFRRVLTAVERGEARAAADRFAAATEADLVNLIEIQQDLQQ